MTNGNRRKFLFAGLSLGAVWAILPFTRKVKEKKTVKFLTQDGKLVEINADRLPPAKKIASGSEIQNWIKNKMG